jgi:hypothetical protein
LLVTIDNLCNVRAEQIGGVALGQHGDGDAIGKCAIIEVGRIVAGLLDDGRADRPMAEAK